MEELFDKVIYRALKRKATDIHLILRETLIINFRIFGEIIHYDTLDNEIGSMLMNYIKYKSLINMNYKYLPQTGDFSISMNKKEYDLRISFLPSLDFESIVIRILNNHEPITLEKLSYQEDVKIFLYDLIHKESGLFLISGATGSGKSTTLYTLIDEITKHQNKNIITIEDPIEMRKQDCLQIELNEKLGITYDQTLKQILRHDPDIIMIGEIRDQNTAKIAITCALTGHLVLTTIHASNAALALKRMLNLGVDKVDLEDIMIGSLSQRIRFDNTNQKVIILSEFMNSFQIKTYLKDDILNYDNFQTQAQNLIQQQHFNPQLFNSDLYG